MMQRVSSYEKNKKAKRERGVICKNGLPLLLIKNRKDDTVCKEARRIVNYSKKNDKNKEISAPIKGNDFEVEDGNLELLVINIGRYFTDYGRACRNIRYKNGDQWSDIVDDPDNKGSY